MNSMKKLYVFSTGLRKFWEKMSLINIDNCKLDKNKDGGSKVKAIILIVNSKLVQYFDIFRYHYFSLSYALCGQNIRYYGLKFHADYIIISM